MKRYAQILIDQKKELQERFEKERIIGREAFPCFKNLVGSKLIKVVTGIRRCGKSVFSAQLLKGKDFGYINFDEEELAGISAPELNQILKSVYEVYGQINYLFLDEVQNIENWELFVNRLQRSGLNLVITGSNAKLLSKELASHLTGRHIALELFPFSFREFLQYRGREQKAETTQEIGLIKKELNEYLTLGGFPEVLKEPEPKVYLRNLYFTILTKDILLRHKIRYAKTFKDIASYAISNFGREISFNKLKNIFNLKSDHTSKNYLGFLEEAYLIFIIEKFSYKKKESLLGNRKVYVIDPGLVKAVGFRFSEDLPHFYENLVAVELLRKRALNQNLEIYYWKNIQQEEVDFVVKEGLKVRQLIQVCYNPEEPDTKKREIRALVKAMKEFKLKEGWVITEDYEGEETIKGKKIKYIPLWKWLLK